MMNFGIPSQPGRGNVGLAVVAGLVVAVACALVWGVIAYATKFQFSIMAILVGLAVGTVMARIGRVRAPAFGIASAVIAVFGCALGSLVAEILVLVRHHQPLSLILSQMNIIFHFYPSTVGGLGFLFWIFAALYGYRIGTGGSFRWGWSRRVRQPRGPYGANQPYGVNQPYDQAYGVNQPYAPGQQPYGAPPQPYGTPAQGYGTPASPYHSPAQPPYGTPAQPPYGAPAQPDYGAPQQPDGGLPPARPGDVTRPFQQPPPGTGST